MYGCPRDPRVFLVVWCGGGCALLVPGQLLECLDAVSLCRLAQVSQAWYVFVHSCPDLWKNLLLVEGMGDDFEFRGTWKDTYVHPQLSSTQPPLSLTFACPATRPHGLLEPAPRPVSRRVRVVRRHLPCTVPSVWATSIPTICTSRGHAPPWAFTRRGSTKTTWTAWRPRRLQSLWPDMSSRTNLVHAHAARARVFALHQPSRPAPTSCVRLDSGYHWRCGQVACPWQVERGVFDSALRRQAVHVWPCENEHGALFPARSVAGVGMDALHTPWLTVGVLCLDVGRYATTTTEERPLYMFDKFFADTAPGLAADYTVPAYFEDDLFDLLLPKAERQRLGSSSEAQLRRVTAGSPRPANRWLIIGAKRSGSTFHIDPNGTSAWNALVTGAKKWVMCVRLRRWVCDSGTCSSLRLRHARYPPHIEPPGVHATADMSEVCVVHVYAGISACVCALCLVSVCMRVQAGLCAREGGVCVRVLTAVSGSICTRWLPLYR